MLMTNDTENKPAQDWNKVAQDALDLWQNHLNNLANDPKLKEDMARMVAPMGQMFNQWASVMQQSMSTFMTPSADQATAQPDSPFETDESASAQSSQPEAQTLDDQNPVSGPDDSIQGDVEQPAAPVAVADDQPVAVLDEPVILSQPEPAPIPEPVVEPKLEQPAVVDVQSTTRGRAPSSDGARDLAQLAGRLAELERELESLRSTSKRNAGGSDESASDAADAGDVQRVAGSGQG